MKRKYNNYFHYTMRVKGKGKTNLRDNIDGAVKPTAQAYKRTSLVSFSNTITARDLFISENEEEIRKCYKQISKDTGIPGGGARQAAIYMMWEEADHDEWEEKARSYVHNIEECVSSLYLLHLLYWMWFHPGIEKSLPNSQLLHSEIFWRAASLAHLLCHLRMLDEEKITPWRRESELLWNILKTFHKILISGKDSHSLWCPERQAYHRF